MTLPEINESIYQSLDGFSQDEMVVALLIARLKTLTTEKTQGIIWSLSFIAQTAPETLFRPYLWAFSHYAHLLPVHRAVLLQVLNEYVDETLIPDVLIGQLLSNYPTGFFLEDQYIRSLVEYNIPLDENAANFIHYANHKYDEDFFLYIHPKYKTLVEHVGTLSGTYKAYIHRRDKISKEHDAYLLRTEGVITPIVSNANASYEIVNRQFYGALKELTYFYYPAYIANLRFLLSEIILHVGALSRRPPWLLMPKKFPSFESQETFSPVEHNGWIILASQEDELYGEEFKAKKKRTSSLLITRKGSAREEGPYAQYLFLADLYKEESVRSAPFDQPICRLSVFDTLERSSIVYVSPFVIRELDLEIDFTIYNGLQACNTDGEIIIRNLAWKEDYYGSISDGTEVPRLAGSAVMIRSDYYEHLLALYPKGCRLIFSSQDNIDQ